MKTIVITGSSRGIGFGLAECFLKSGHQVVLNGRREETLENALTTLAKNHPKELLAGIPGDVGVYQQVAQLWDFAVAQFGQVDIWINNAGIGQSQIPFWELEPGLIQNLVQTNLIGAMFGAQVALAGFQEQGRGAFYNMEGLGSDGRRVEGLAVYGTTKRALNYLTESLAGEVEGTNIIVGAISPGMVMTDLNLDRFRDRPREEWENTRRIFNILADRVDTVAPYIAEKVIQNRKNGARIQWLTREKVLWRFLTAGLTKRDLFKDFNL